MGKHKNKVTLVRPADRVEYTKEMMVKEAIKRYSNRDYTYVVVFGVDTYTTAFVEGLWQNPNIIKLIISDPEPEKLTDLNKRIGGLPFSRHRWFPMQATGFFSDNPYPLIVMAEELMEEHKGYRKKGTRLRTIKQLSEGKFG